jgi:hypothetical protein
MGHRTLVDTMMLGYTRTEVSQNPQREHRRSRRKGGTHPERISLMRNVGTPMGSVVQKMAVSRLQGRPKPSAGTGRTEKRRSAAERQGETITRRIGLMLNLKGC